MVKVGLLEDSCESSARQNKASELGENAASTGGLRARLFGVPAARAAESDFPGRFEIRDGLSSDNRGARREPQDSAGLAQLAAQVVHDGGADVDV